MAGDEKNARELIACARNDLADAERCQRLGMTPSVGTLMRTLRQMTAALEAALPGDDDWEYGTAHASEPEKGAPEPNRRAAELRRNAWNDTTQSRTSLLVRRRRAGRWEPVEEVPRA